MLEKLGRDGEQIMELYLSKDQKTCELVEACDSYFSVKLNRSKLMELIRDLTDIADRMRED